jgi:S-formylglutathione hydrolase FrmB
MQLAGARSGISRNAYVWLPPQYGEPAFAHTELPVLELLHGYPGRPSDWLTGLRLSAVLDEELAAHRIGPMVVVMPTINPASWPGSQECTNEVGGPQDATYLAVDVPADIAHAFRVVPPGPSWGIGGFSTGGYCAAMLALRNPASFGAIVDLDGYLHPSEGGFLPRRFRGDLAAESGYDVADLFAHDAHGPLPAFDIVTGSGVRADEQDATALAQLVRTRESVSLVVERGAGHTFYAWADALPSALDWAWRAIAPLGLQRAVPTFDPAIPGRADVRVVTHPLDRISTVLSAALAAHRRHRS